MALTVGRINFGNAKKMTPLSVLQEINRLERERTWGELTKHNNPKRNEGTMSEPQTIRRGLMADTELTTFMKALNDLPGRIRETSDSLTQAEHELDIFDKNQVMQAKEAVEALELEAAYEAANEINGDGKKKNTNEQQRKAATAMILSKSEEYATAVNAYAHARQKKGELANHVGKLRNMMFYVRDQFKAQLAIAGIVQGLSHEHENGQLLSYLSYQKDKLGTAMNQLKEGI